MGGAGLDALCQRLVCDPLGLSQTGYRPLPGPEVRDIAPTGSHRPREPAPGQEHLYEAGPEQRPLRLGEVDDDNAYAMGGVAGHAGLFSTALDVARWGARVLEEERGAGRLGPGVGEAIATLRAPDVGPTGPLRALGFDLARGEGSTAGRLASVPGGAFGHLGFTGGSVWVAPSLGVSVALLTNPRVPDAGADRADSAPAARLSRRGGGCVGSAGGSLIPLCCVIGARVLPAGLDRILSRIRSRPLSMPSSLRSSGRRARALLPSPAALAPSTAGERSSRFRRLASSIEIRTASRPLPAAPPRALSPGGSLRVDVRPPTSLGRRHSPATPSGHPHNENHLSHARYSESIRMRGRRILALQVGLM